MFQEIALVETEALGRGLILDGVAQYWECDEWIYHEHLAALPLLFHANPQRVLILGGGDGLALREVLRDARVAEAVLVDIDGTVIDVCRSEHADLHQDSFADPRATILVDDALQYLQSGPAAFDVVIIDLVDALESDAQELYHRCVALLKQVSIPTTLIVGHGAASPLVPTYLVIEALLETCFEHAASYQTFIPSWATAWGFVLASATLDPHTVDAAVLAQRATQRSTPLRSINPHSFPGAFARPPHFEALFQTIKATDNAALV